MVRGWSDCERKGRRVDAESSEADEGEGKEWKIVEVRKSESVRGAPAIQRKKPSALEREKGGRGEGNEQALCASNQRTGTA